MEIAEAKNLIEGAIEPKFKEISDLIKKGEEQIKNSDKMAVETQTELKNLTDKVSELQTQNVILSKQGDALEIWAKRQNADFEVRSKGLVSDMSEQFSQKKSELDKIVNKQQKSIHFDFSQGQSHVHQKAVGLVTTALSTTGTLPTSFRDTIVMPQNRKLHIRSIIGSSPMTDVNYSYARYTDGEGSVGIQTEGSSKAQLDADVAYVTLAPVEIAAYMRVSKQILRDIPRLESTIANRLIELLLKFEDSEILNGPGGANRLNGILTQATAFVPTGVANTSNADRFSYIYSAISQLTALDYTPNGILVHPYAYYEMLQNKTTTKEYTSPYSAITWLDGTLRLAGIPVYQSTAQAQNSFTVGEWNEAELLVRDDLSVDISMEDQDNFIKNLVTIRVEERVGLAVYKPGAFITGSWNGLAS